MTIIEALRARRSEVLARWQRLVLETYPAQSARLFARQQSPFANPVGTAITAAGERLFELLCDGVDAAALEDGVGPLVRIRAVQEHAPSGAVIFVPLLRRAVREELGDLFADPAHREEVAPLESRLESLLLGVFDLYTHCREEIAALRVREAQRHVSGLMRRLGVPAFEPREHCVPQSRE